MEHLFSPCTRLFDQIEDHDVLGEDDWEGDFGTVKELNLDVSTEELLSAERAFTYADLYAMIANENAVLWLTPHAALMPEDGKGLNYCGQLGMSRQFRFSADGKVLYVLALSFEYLLEISDVVTRLLAASVVHSVLLKSWNSRDGALINAPTLAYLMEQCQSLKVLELVGLECLDENHCRVLGTYSRPDLEITLDQCSFTSAGLSALVAVLERNQGPTSLKWCKIDYSVLADGLRGNSRLKSLVYSTSRSFEDDKRQVLAIASALRENKGLVELNLRHDDRRECDETWYAVCDSLKTHPTLQVLHLCPVHVPLTVPAVIKSRIQALADAMKVNMSIHTIHLHNQYSKHELFRQSTIPYLKTNRLRPRLLAIQKTLPTAYRAKVLGRALLSARTDPNRFWILLSGNPEVAFQSTTATTTPAARFSRRFWKCTPAARFSSRFYKCTLAACFSGRFCKCCYSEQ
jgi:hypothetical protein